MPRTIGFSDHLRTARYDRSEVVQRASDRVVDLLRRTDLSRLDQPGRDFHRACIARHEAILAEYQRVAPGVAASIEQRAAGLESKDRIRTLVGIALVVVSVLLILGAVSWGARAFWFGVFLLVATLVVRSITKRWLLGQARALVPESSTPSRQALEALGNRETPKLPSSGLYREVDGVYLASLDPMQRQMEVQQRQHELQMRRMEIQHNQAMAAQQQAMQDLLEDQRAAAEDDGGTGFLASAVRGYKAGKRSAERERRG